MAGRHILEPVIRYDYTGSPAQKFKYLQIPVHITHEDLETEIKNGASPFREVTKLIDMEGASNFVVITSDNLENAYMAVMYHAAVTMPKWLKEEMCMGDHQYPGRSVSKTKIKDIKDSGKDIDPTPIELDVTEEETLEMEPDYFDDDESPSELDIPRDAIPIITWSEYQIEVNSTSTPFELNNQIAMGGNRQIKVRPYWTELSETPLCIICDGYENNGFCGGFSGLSESAIDELTRFDNKRAIYLIFVKRKQDQKIPSWLMDDELEESFNDEENDEISTVSYIDIFKSKLVLATLAEEIDVKVADLFQWMRYLVRSHAEDSGCCMKKGFPYKRLFKVVDKISEDAPASLIAKMMHYARRKKKGDSPYTITDFSFMERFVTIRVKTKRKARGWKRLERELIGLDSIKEQVRDVVNVMKFNRIREQMNITGSTYHNVHMMLGAPGTAKTTVAQIMGEIMTEEGLLPDQRFICVNGAELKGLYVGHSAPKTHQLFEQYDIIVIDEAYSLVENNGETDSFSREAIAQLIIELEKHANDKLVIFAGYGGGKVTEKNDKMREFLDSNPGIRSRITHTFLFDSYTPDDMVKIFYRQTANMQYTLDENASSDLRDYFEERIRDVNFGNGREARSLLESTVVFAARRVMEQGKSNYSKNEMKSLKPADVRAAIKNARDTTSGLSPARKSLGFLV